jgi:hypothetical protein
MRKAMTDFQKAILQGIPDELPPKKVLHPEFRMLQKEKISYRKKKKYWLLKMP